MTWIDKHPSDHRAPIFKSPLAMGARTTPSSHDDGIPAGLLPTDANYIVKSRHGAITVQFTSIMLPSRLSDYLTLKPPNHVDRAAINGRWSTKA
jgi:hypothetical protein